MSSNPDRAARAFAFTSVAWLLVGAFSFAAVAAKLVAPGSLATAALSYGRLRAISSIALQYGWLDLASLAAVFYVIPRVTGVRMRSEKGGLVAAGLINVAVLFGAVITMASGVKGSVFQELPAFLDVLIVAAHLMVAMDVVRAVAKRREPRIYASAWYMAAGAIWFPIAMALGNLTSFSGVPDAIATMFALNSVLLLWFAAVGIGTVYYILPRISGAPLYSHPLALAGLAVLGFAGPMAAQGRMVFGPSQDWLQTLGTAASIGLLFPAVTLMVNVFGTLRGSWEHVPAHPSAKFAVGGTVLFFIAILQQVGQSFRSVSRSIGLTDWVDGQIWLLIIGSFTLWAVAGLVYAVPRIVGRRWQSGTVLSIHFWFTVIGASLFSISTVVSGLMTAGAVNTAVSLAKPIVSGLPFEVLLNMVARFRLLGFVGAALLAVGQAVFVLTLFRTTQTGEQRAREIVSVGAQT